MYIKNWKQWTVKSQKKNVNDYLNNMPLYTQTECKYQPQRCRGPRQADAPKAPPRDRNQGQGSGRT